MSRPPRLEFPGAVYHVIARGNERRAIFRDDDDRRRYLGRLGTYSARFDFAVYAYCLMTNHIHLALETSGPPLSRIMLALHGSYSQEFNRRHRRVGHLFQGRYKAFLVEADEHLATLLRYIHMNPVKAGIVARPQQFEWSSDRAYRGVGGPSWLTTSVALSYFAPTPRAAMRAYEAFMDDGSGPRYEDLDTHAQLVRGDEEFLVRVVGPRDPEIVRRSLSAERVGELVANAFGLGPDAFRSAPSRIRAVTGYVGREVARIPLCRIATLFAKHETSLVKDVRRLELDLKSDSELRSKVTSLLRVTSNSAIQR